MAKLALAVIAKDELDHLVRIVNDYEKYFDEIVFAIDDEETIKNLQELYKDNSKIALHKYEWVNDFSHKRNFLASKIKSDYYFRIDTDDKIENAHLIPQAFKGYVRQGFTEIFMMYYYSFDASGNPTSKHWRESIIKNDGNLYWNKKIHENLIPKNQNKVSPAKEEKISVIHIATHEQHAESFERNLKMLMDEYEQTKDKPDARTIGYIARMLMGAKRTMEAIPFFEMFLEKSGWEDDKYFAWCQLADCYSFLAGSDAAHPALETALSCAVEAMLMKPEYPDAYFHLLSIYVLKKDWKKAIEFGTLGFSKKTPDTMYIIDPSSYTYRPLTLLAISYMSIGNYDKARELSDKALEIAPKDSFVKETNIFVNDIARDEKVIRSYIDILLYTRGDIERFRAAIKSIPKKIYGDERIIAIKNKVEPPTKWPDDSVVIFCGGSWEDWIDTSVIGGIGGSEEAVIYLSRELVKLGKKVTVYNQCGELGGTYNGVEYKSYYEFNPNDRFNILISWRNNIFGNINARKKIVWLHDVPYKNMFSEDDYKAIDHIVVLSEYHKSLLPNNPPKDKIYVSTNGINLQDFFIDGIERKSKRCIWTSSYDRGLEPFLEIVWPEVIKEVPDAELHIYYGWNTYKKMMDEGKRPKEFYHKMLELMNQKGVFEHGRIGHKKLVREIMASGIWAYPTTFEEINCISAIKAQAGGAIPCVNNYAALREVVKWGVRVEGNVKENSIFNDYTKKLIKLLKSPEYQENIRKEMMEKARENWGWKRIAEEWIANLF